MAERFSAMMEGNRELPYRQERKSRDSSTSKKPKRLEPSDTRPIITQEKPVSKSSRTSLKDKGKSQSDKTHEKSQKKRAKSQDDYNREEKIPSSERDGSSTAVSRRKSTEPKSRRESKLDVNYVKNLVEKKGIKKTETGKVGKDKSKEKPVKVIHDVAAAKFETIQEDEKVKPKTRRDRTRTRTLSPTEVKQLMGSKSDFDVAGSGDFGTDVKDEGEKWKQTEEIEMKEDNDDDYEDDFEDYDSDFEDEDDDDSAPKEPPANPTPLSPPPQPHLVTPKREEIENQWKINLKKKEIEEIKKSIEKENQELPNRRKSITKPSEDDSDKENISVKSPSTGIVDFSSASRRQRKSRKTAESRRRGEELLNMITLDTISYNILEIPPIPYEDFMKAFGKSNTKQVYTQTNEDNLDEEIQTEEVQLSNKWTQHPAEYLGSRNPGNEISFVLTKEERLGVGGDVLSEEEITIQPKTNELWNFLSWASQLVLVALEKKSGNFLSLDNMPNHSKAVAFGDGFVNLNVRDIPFLSGRSVTQLCPLAGNLGRLLSVHTNKEISFQKCMICLWSLRELSKPLKVLIASNKINSCCFGPNEGNLVFAGLNDGSICVWDLREPVIFHNRMTNSSEWSLQSPTYSTAGCLKDEGHSSPVVAVRLRTGVELSSRFGDFTPIQIISLDKDGTIIIWTVVQMEKSQGNAPSEDLGLANWGRVKLVKSSTFCVFGRLREEVSGRYTTCNDILLNETNFDGFYVSCSDGHVYHCSSDGCALRPKFYFLPLIDYDFETTCLELCPFNVNYFLVGSCDGTIMFYSRDQDTPLTCFSLKEDVCIVSLSWMSMRPCVFFALDSLSR